MLERMLASVKDAQFLSALAENAKVLALPPANSNVLSAEQFSNRLSEKPPIRQLNVTVVRAEQSLNTARSRTLTYAGIVMLSRLVHPSKKEAPMLPAAVGNVTDSSAVQPANTPVAVRLLI